MRKIQDGLLIIIGVLLLFLLARSMFPVNAGENQAGNHFQPLNNNIQRISMTTSGTTANDVSDEPAISADGCWIVFTSGATDLASVGIDTNDQQDIFLYHRCGTTIAFTRISQGLNGQPANGSSWEPTLSADGRYIAFSSSASNLVVDDLNGITDVFVYDRQTGTTIRVSRHSNGTEGNGLSLHPSISDNGQMITFSSEATNLVTGDSNNVKDIFIHNRVSGTTTRVSVADDESQANGLSDNPALSIDGRYIAFESIATNLVANDTNATVDVFVRDTVNGTTERVSVDSSGVQGNRESYDADISADGRYVAFESWATNLVISDDNGRKDIFVRDRQTIQTIRVSYRILGDIEANEDSGDPSITVVNGFLHVAFVSWAGNLDPLNPEDLSGSRLDIDSDIFLHDGETGEISRITVHQDGPPPTPPTPTPAPTSVPWPLYGHEDSLKPAISGNGEFIVFKSRTRDLVGTPPETTKYADVYIWQAP